MLVAACSESPRADSPTLPELFPHGARASRASGIGKGWAERRYLLRVDRGRKILELKSFSTQAVNSGCSLTEVICDDGSTTCQTLGPECGLWYGIVQISGGDSIHVNNGASGYDATVDEFGPYYCPLYVDDPHFEWRGHHFKIDGRVQKIADLAMISGIPKGRYLLPPGPWSSDDGQARIWSGTIDGTCFVRDHHVLGFRVTEGFMAWYKFTGDGDDTTASSGDGGGTWVSYGGGGGGGYIDSDAAQVLKTYLETEACTNGWVIIVDGVRVC